jgi:hypothetical protein
MRCHAIDRSIGGEHSGVLVRYTRASLPCRLASARYYDDLPTTGNAHGRAFRDLDLEAQVHKLCQVSVIAIARLVEWIMDGAACGAVGWLNGTSVGPAFLLRRNPALARSLAASTLRTTSA